MSHSPEVAGLPEHIAEQVLAMDVFQKMPAATKRRFVRFAEIRTVEAGQEFLHQGEFTSDFQLVLRGLVTGFRREEDGSSRRLVELGGGDWFGEVSALSNQPSPARYVASSRCVLLVLEAGLFKEVYRSTRAFRSAVDERYRERSLALHLAVVPALASLGRGDLRRLRKAATFEVVAEGEPLVDLGAPMDAVILVRSGAVVRKTAPSGGAPEGRTTGYLMENSSFGEEALWDPEARWDHVYEARTSVELVRIPVERIRKVLGPESEAYRNLAAVAEKVTSADRSTPHEDEVHGMLHRGSVKGGEALVIDLGKCVRCNACVESCVAVHDDGIPRLSKSGFRVSAEASGSGRPLALVTSCYHCQVPGCMMACSYGAIRRDPQGLIRILGENCVGCAMCVDACPYDVIRLTDPADSAQEDGFLAKIPVVGKLFANGQAKAAAPERTGYHKDDDAMGKAVKCDRCEGLPFEACVYNCPCGAIERREPADIFSGPHAAPNGG